ncbi:MAG: hypothetical protein WCF28_04915 [Methanobacterium sp.]|uniref:hypothetical protein n=1 Tax=Methanobacterium sp. TaxID=2164 RepID=UPI003C773BD0
MTPRTKKVKEVGKMFQIGERTFYPIVEISTVEMETSFAESISPIALVIVEPLKKYILPLTEDEVDSDEIIDLFDFT